MLVPILTTSSQETEVVITALKELICDWKSVNVVARNLNENHSWFLSHFLISIGVAL